MTSNTVTKNTTYLTLSYVGQKILSFFYFVMVARFIGVEDLGKYTFALGFTTMFAVFVDFGLTQTLIRETAKFKEKVENYVSSIIGVKVVFSIVIYLAVILLVNLMGYPAITKQLVYLAGIIMLIDSFTLTLWGIFRGARNLKYESISIVINQAIILGVGLTVLFLGLPLHYLMLPFLLGSAFSMLFAFFSTRKVLKLNYKITWNNRILKTLFKISLPFALIAIFSRIYGYIDSVMLSKLIGDSAVGWYSVAMKIPFALQFIPAALAAAIFPAFSHLYVTDKLKLKQTFDRGMKFLAILVLPISFGIAVLSEPIILTLYGNDYSPAIEPLSILMIGLFFVFMNFPLGSLLNSCDRQVTNTKLVGITMVFNIILNIFLIPAYSFVGAAIAFLISHGFLFLASLFIARRIIPYSKRHLLSVIVKTGISAFVMAVVLFYLNDFINFVILIPIGAVIYFIVLFAIKGMTIRELKILISVILKRK